MTSETYHWERQHESDPPVSLSVMRSFPDGDWTVQSEQRPLPAHFPTHYETLKDAMRAADDLAELRFHPDHGHESCGDWVPVPPTFDVEG